MRNYGRNFVVFESSSETTLSKCQLLEKYKHWYDGKKQKQRMLQDINYLNKLDLDKKYVYALLQYTGHSRIPSGSYFDGKKLPWIFISNVIDWN